MNAKDIKLDENEDIDIEGGDFRLADSDQVHIEHILRSNKGYWFEYPLLGVGIISEQNGSKSRQQLKQDIRRQLVYDNFSIRQIKISNDNEIDINAVRKL